MEAGGAVVRLSVPQTIAGDLGDQRNHRDAAARAPEDVRPTSAQSITDAGAWIGYSVW